MTPSVRETTPDEVLAQIAEYVCGSDSFSEEAYATARLSLMDSLGCGLLARKLSAVRKAYRAGGSRRGSRRRREGARHAT